MTRIIDEKLKFLRPCSQGLGGTGIEDDESINSPQKMQWEEATNFKQAALGGQVR